MDIENCRGMLGDLSDYLDGSISDEFCQEIEEHMAGCEDCRIVVDTLGKTIMLYHQLPQPAIPDDTRIRLYHSLDLTEFLSEQA